MLGKNGSIYLSHKPMLHAGLHGFQVILEVTLVGPAKGPIGKGNDPGAIYRGNKAAAFSLKAVAPNGGMFDLNKLKADPSFR